MLHLFIVIISQYRSLYLKSHDCLYFLLDMSFMLIQSNKFVNKTLTSHNFSVISN